MKYKELIALLKHNNDEHQFYWTSPLCSIDKVGKRKFMFTASTEVEELDFTLDVDAIARFINEHGFYIEKHEDRSSAILYCRFFEIKKRK